MKKLILILIVLTLLILPKNIEAALCTQDAMEKARDDAYKLKFTYEIKKRYDEETTSDVYYYEITVEGLTKEIFIVGDQNYTYGTNPDNPTRATFELEYDGEGTVFNPRIKASQYNDCYGETVYTPTINLPSYNVYYNTEDCLKYPEFKYCKKDYQGEEPTKEEFNEELDKYIKETDEDNETDPDKEVKENYLDLIVKYIRENKIMVISVSGGLAIFITVIVVVKVRKNKKRVKINLEV